MKLLSHMITLFHGGTEGRGWPSFCLIVECEANKPYPSDVRTLLTSGHHQMCRSSSFASLPIPSPPETSVHDAFQAVLLRSSP